MECLIAGDTCRFVENRQNRYFVQVENSEKKSEIFISTKSDIFTARAAAAAALRRRRRRRRRHLHTRAGQCEHW